jgi:hypothetical protein
MGPLFSEYFAFVFESFISPLQEAKIAFTSIATNNKENKPKRKTLEQTPNYLNLLAKITNLILKNFQ